MGSIILKKTFVRYPWKIINGVFFCACRPCTITNSIPFFSIKFSCGQYASACAAVTRITFFITCLLYQNTICREIDCKCIPNLNGEHMFRYTSKNLLSDVCWWIFIFDSFVDCYAEVNIKVFWAAQAPIGSSIWTIVINSNSSAYAAQNTFILTFCIAINKWIKNENPSVHIT